MEKKSVAFVGVLLIMIICFIVFLFLLDQYMGGKIVRKIVCGMLFWIPGAASALALSQGCAAIP